MGANANAADNAGNTAMMHVAKEFYIKDMIEAFVAAGGDLNLRNKKGQTAGDIYRSLPEVRKAIKEGYQEYADRENEMIDTAKLFPEPSKLGPAIGKVFSVDGKKIEITGRGAADKGDPVHVVR